MKTGLLAPFFIIRVLTPVIVIALIGPAVANAQPDPACLDDSQCLRQLVSDHPVKQARTWRAFLNLPLSQRVMAAPAKVVDYLNLDNRLRGFPNQPRTALASRQFLQDIRLALAEIPPQVIAQVDTRLAGIFLVEDLGGTGYTDYIYADNRQPVGALMVLDIAALQQAANAWATWKENTPFEQDTSFKLTATIEQAGSDNRQQALQYILLHEFGHVASIGRAIHPPWDEWDCRVDPPTNFQWFQQSWKLEDGNDCAVVSKFDNSVFSRRSEIVYYFGARLPATAMPEVYAQLGQTNFPSLYAATSPADDFAESFVTYVHQVLMKKPFSIRIESDGGQPVVFTGCWSEPRCAEKQKMLESLLAGTIP